MLATKTTAALMITGAATSVRAGASIRWSKSRPRWVLSSATIATITSDP